MKIRLVRTGGFIPVKKVSEIEADLSEASLTRLIDFLKSAPPPPRYKDGTNYEIFLGNEGYSLNMEKMPGEFMNLVDELKSKLQIVKPT